MKRFLFVTLALIICSMSSFAGHVSENTAKNVAKTFLTAKVNMPIQKGTAGLQLVYQSASTQKGTEKDVYFYVFNVDESGFIIVSGSDNVTPVLAYSDESNFDPDNIPPSMVWWLSQYSQSIRYAIENDIQPAEKTVLQWDELISGNIKSRKATEETVSPLLGDINWNQAPIYNDSCPIDMSTDSYYNYRCVTGCVATAMAQVIRYWEYPTVGIGSRCYYADYASEGFGDYGLQCADFENTTYNYASMPGTLNYYSTSAQKRAVAQLMYHCGVSVNMMYGRAETGGSGAYTLLDPYWISMGYMDVPTALKEYFGYSTARGLSKSDYATDAQWIAILKDQLDKKQPILYSGRSSAGGHAFVCDGYNLGNYFHFNWGWGGSANCYCTVDNLLPEGTGIGGGDGDYTQNQQIIIDIRADKEEKTLGWKHSTEYIHDYSGTFTRTYLTLLPDTCLKKYDDGVESTASNFHSIGMIFDPYSESYGEDDDAPLFSKSSHYRLDTIQIVSFYLMSEQGYNESSPDTLRVHFSYYEPYTEVGEGVDYEKRYFSPPYYPYITPYITAINSSNQKGDAIKPKIANTITFDYVLTKEDTSAAVEGEPGSYYYSNIKIPLTYNNLTAEGFEIPAGAVLSTAVKFIPGYDYQYGDTLSNSVSGNFSLKKNRYGICYYYSTEPTDVLNRDGGYNCAFYENKVLRYQINNSDADNYYAAPMAYIPDLSYHITYDITPAAAKTEIDTSACGEFAYNGTTYTKSGNYKHYFPIEGGDSVVTLNLTILETPEEVGNIQGDVVIPQTGNYNYSISPVAGAASYQWTISNNKWTITGSGTAISLNVSEKGVGTLTVKAIHANGVCETENSIKINFCDALGTMDEISGESLIKDVGTYKYSITSVENAASYQWKISNEDWMILGSPTGTSIDLLVETKGTGTLFVKAFDLCGNFSEKTYNIVSNITDIASHENEAKIEIYPNPTKDYFSVVLNDTEINNVEIQVFDLYGKILTKVKADNKETKIDMSAFAEGIYLVRIANNNAVLKTSKIVKTK